MNKIMIVDDDLKVRRMARRALQKLWPNVEIAEAGDGIQAVRIAREFAPDILMLDLMLPGQDGFAVLRDLKEDDRLKSILVLGMTAYNSPDNLARLAKSGT